MTRRNNDDASSKYQSCKTVAVTAFPAKETDLVKLPETETVLFPFL